MRCALDSPSAAVDLDGNCQLFNILNPQYCCSDFQPTSGICTL